MLRYVPQHRQSLIGKANTIQARYLVSQSDGIEQTRALAAEYAQKALDAIAPFPESEAKEGLKEMVAKTLNRRK